ncbi:retrovirus-related pol polyprotein from transposon TNT 1-94 [Tanacetum coccineum]
MLKSLDVIIMNEFYAKKGIKMEFGVARTPQQNGVAERKNRTLIEAARTMLAKSLLPIPFWAEAVNTVYYVLNRVLVTKPQNKTPYELLIGNSPSISFMRPFGCPLTILNTLDSLGKFDGKSDEGYFLGYSTSSKVFSFLVKKAKKISGNVTPLFESMLVQPTEYEGEASERQSEPQPTPSPPHLSADQYETQPDPSPRPSPTIPIPDSIPEGSGGNHGGQSSSDRSLSGNEDGLTLQSVYDLCVSLCKQVTDQAKEIKHLKAQIKKLKKKAKPVITHHKAWMKSVSMKQRLAGKKSLKTKWMQKESVSKQGRKPAKAEPIVHKDPAFDDLDDIVDDAMDYMESEDAQDKGRTSSVVLEEKESTQKGVSTEVEVSTVKPDEGTDKSKEVEVSTDKLDKGTAEPKDRTSDESTAPTTVFRDDETIAEFLVSMSQNKAKQKGVEIKDAEDSDRPRATSTRSVLTLKPLPKIDPKDKGKKVLEEEATKAALIQDFDDILARIEADRLLVARLQEEDRETFPIEERAKFLYDTIAA